MPKLAPVESPPPKEKRTPLLPGQPVTLILPDHVVLVEVTTSEKDRFGCVLTSRAGKQIVSEHKLTGEGKTWILGYHLADSPEVMACRAAKGLE